MFESAYVLQQTPNGTQLDPTMPCLHGKRLQKIDWQKYYLNLPFNESALALYEWSPIADELKTLDKKIVLNSMILKWDNVKKEFPTLINF